MTRQRQAPNFPEVQVTGKFKFMSLPSVSWGAGCYLRQKWDVRRQDEAQLHGVGPPHRHDHSTDCQPHFSSSWWSLPSPSSPKELGVVKEQSWSPRQSLMDLPAGHLRTHHALHQHTTSQDEPWQQEKSSSMPLRLLTHHAAEGAMPQPCRPPRRPGGMLHSSAISVAHPTAPSCLPRPPQALQSQPSCQQQCWRTQEELS